MELHLILLLMIIAALAAVQMKDLISSLIALSAVGLGLSLAFLVLKAPNLAITQLVVEILCIIILVRGTIKKDLPIVRDGRWLFNTTATVLFLALFLIFVYFTLKELPVFGQPAMSFSGEYLTKANPLGQPLNLVSALSLKFRNLDALVESGILFAALVAVLAISRKSAKNL